MPAQMCTPWLCIRRCRNDGRKKKRPEYDRNFSQHCSPSLKAVRPSERFFRMWSILLMWASNGARSARRADPAGKHTK
jgi:hypothetical protein